MKTILVPIDFSPVTRAVIAEAVALGRALRARLVLLNAVQPPMIVTELAPLVGEALQYTAEVERGSRNHLRRLQSSLAARHIKVDAVCAQEFPVALILAQARKLKARYIVLGSHGHSAFYDLVAGSTANGVLKRATCPVVIVPAAPTGSKPSPRRRK